MADQSHRTGYADPHREMQDYLDFMLRQATETQPDIGHEPEPEPEAEATVQEEDLPPAADATPADAPPAEEPAEPLVPATPDWADSEFPSLLFRVRGMDMAAPLVHLGGIANVSEEALQPVAGQASWFIGLMRWNGRTIRIVDTARLLMGEQEAAQTPEENDKRRGYRCMVVLHGTDWGLAIDAPDESRTLRRDDVRWRRQRGQRPWLAGTLSDSLCSLLDTGAIIEDLAPIAPVSHPDDDASSLAGVEFAKQTLTAGNSVIKG